MKLTSPAISLLLLVGAISSGQSAKKPDQEAPSKVASTTAKVSQTAPVAGQAGPANDDAPSAELKTVLAQMNLAATRFKSLQADFEWETFDNLIKATEVHKGKAYFRRPGKDIESLFNFYADSP